MIKKKMKKKQKMIVEVLLLMIKIKVTLKVLLLIEEKVEVIDEAGNIGKDEKTVITENAPELVDEKKAQEEANTNKGVKLTTQTATKEKKKACC